MRARECVCVCVCFCLRNFLRQIFLVTRKGASPHTPQRERRRRCGSGAEHQVEARPNDTERDRTERCQDGELGTKRRDMLDEQEVRATEGMLACENIEEGDEMSGCDRRRSRTGEARAAAPAPSTEGAR